MESLLIVVITLFKFIAGMLSGFLALILFAIGYNILRDKL